ncbi:MAG: tRNA (adenosine(37)-N6)-dimethylallyltransferase MiaA [Bacteroidetes bacterium]|nr:MAG: tRNA (adenosine(37)-N6)-dimethylallyltransferase MiaA [Bacteroidota bacterium]
MSKYLVVIGGPTAVGKTELAIRLALHFDTVILSADSRQIYKELNIGVAKPTSDQLNLVPHYFISHISIKENYSAYDYQQEVHQLLPQLFERHDVVIMVGGTGFYIHAVLNGLNEIPKISEETKQAVANIYAEKGIAFLQQELREKDPTYYFKADIQNPVRLLRALEVIYETGRPFSDFLNDRLIKKPEYFVPVKLWLNTNRELLYQRINNRVLSMIESGLEKEVQDLLPYKHLKSLNTVGYKEWWHYFDGRVSLNSVIEQIQKNTRHYAKRQITWFKHQWEAKEIKLKFLHSEQNFIEVLSYIQKHLP